MKLVSIVGMPGAGKSVVAREFELHGYTRIRFGDITDQEIARNGLELNEATERNVRERLRREHGMAAYAILNLPRIESTLALSPVVIDGLYSWEEYLCLKGRFNEGLTVVAVWASPATRYARLGARAHRPLTREEAAARDRAEIENVNKGGPIAMADMTIKNDSSLEELLRETEKIIARLNRS